MSRLRYERRRVGAWRLLDVLAFRLFYRLCLSTNDGAWLQHITQELETKYTVPGTVPKVLMTENPNSEETRSFISDLTPHLAIARCKKILRKSIYSIPIHGTFVLHPGICPEYRNAHGCYWALARSDLKKVGATLLRVDSGVDTGPVYGYFPYRNPDPQDSHIKIQYRVVLDNLHEIQEMFIEIMRGDSTPISVAARESAVYGQPWLSKYSAFRKNLAALCANA